MAKKAVISVFLVIIVTTVLVLNNIFSYQSIEVNGSYLTMKMLDNPHSVAFDSKGNIYVADSVRLKKIDSLTGKITEFSRFSSRCMTALIDRDNNVYACTPNEVYKINQNGEKKLFSNLFTRADGFEQDSKGNIYVADAFKDIVYKITPEGSKSIYIDSETKNQKPSTYYVTGLLFSPDYKKLYTVRHSQNKIMEYPINNDGSCGEGIEYCTLGIGTGPDYMVMDENGYLYVTSYYKNCILRISPEKEVTRLKPKGIKLKNPTGIAFGIEPRNTNSIYIANYEGSSIVEIKLGVKEASKES